MNHEKDTEYQNGETYETRHDLPIKSSEFAVRASIYAKAELDKEVEFFTLPTENAVKFYTMPKNAICGIYAKAKQGKSIFLVDLALFLLASKQVKRVIYYDVDSNYTALKSRNQSEYAKKFDNFFLFTDEKIIELATEQLETLKSFDLSSNPNMADEINEKGKSLAKLLDKGDFLALFKYLLSDGTFGLDDTAIFLDSLNGFIPKISDNQAVKEVFLRTIRPLTRKGASMFYLAHTTKGKNLDGTSDYQGAQSLEACSDYFCELERPDENLFSIVVKANRHAPSMNYSVERYGKSEPLTRLKKVAYVEINQPSDTQQKARNLITSFLDSQDGKKARWKDILSHSLQNGISRQVFNTALKALYEQGKVTQIFIANASFYKLSEAIPQPKIIEFGE